ncbi:hypothetical protein BM525_19295 (plasmid) [Alteromonas mediterranea]|uniref:Uncharacterized protein n=1 Tax=Alteromonas mediterranea TaxID=314275 RepID=A0AAC9JGE3_9ALTE|nr:hypothetical protein [Alteromonas mediterranea]APD92030.1 hypothetical protein BM524_19100 [Alteromonas mediterranea]APD99884.1 hypothetical protein BM525_19295 [Alteromonas mediterranea]
MNYYNKLLFLIFTLFTFSARAEIVEKELISNPYFQGDMFDTWTQAAGSTGLRTFTEVDGEARYYWYGGKSSYSAIYSETNMIEDEGINANLINAGVVNYDFSVLYSSYSRDSDKANSSVLFYDEDMNVLLNDITGWVNVNTWTEYSLSGIVPTGAVYSRVYLHASRASGTNNDGYIYSPALMLSVTDEVALQMYGNLVVDSPMMPVSAIAFFGSMFCVMRKRRKSNHV